MMDDSICIRAATEADIPWIADTERQCFSRPWTEDGIRGELSLPDSRFFVLIKDEKRCGYINSRTVLDECYIGNVAVCSAYRRQGLGERLLNALIADRKKAGCAFISLEVRASNLPARRLYEKLGFAPVGVRKAFYSEPVENAVIYTLNL